MWHLALSSTLGLGIAFLGYQTNSTFADGRQETGIASSIQFFL
jgi:hypothetical protein